MYTDSTAVKDARAPFSGSIDPNNAQQPTDFILRSSDGVDFHVHREILKFASDAFDGMFSIPAENGGPEQITRDGKPVVVLSEAEPILYKLLSLAYPARTLAEHTLTSKDLDSFLQVYEAAGKYQFLGVQSVLASMLFENLALMKAAPYRVFALARLCKLPQVACRAALASLKSSADFLKIKFPEMKMITWEVAHTLLEFHKQCGLLARQHCTGELTLVDSLQLRRSIPDPPPVWWVETGHSKSCVGQLGKPGLHRENRAVKSVPFLGGTLNQIESIIETDIAWFKSHIRSLSAALYETPGQFSPNLDISDYATIASCAVCLAGAKADLAALHRRLERSIGDENVRMAIETFGEGCESVEPCGWE